MNKLLYVAIAIVIVILVATFIYVNGSNGSNLLSYKNQPVPINQVNQLKAIAMNSSLANKVGVGFTEGNLKNISGNTIIVNGKPTIVYFGADYCPFCAVTRWGLIIALSRFGNFTNLHYMISNSTDVYPNTATFTFYNSSYSSNYVNFMGTETETYTHAGLEVPNNVENATFSAYNTGGGIPFLDFNNKSIQIGALISPQLLHGDNWAKIITLINNSNSTISQAIIGSANIYTAKICSMDNNTPSKVCNQSYVKRLGG